MYNFIIAVVEFNSKPKNKNRNVIIALKNEICNFVIDE
jgi:hypothetical protein